MHIQESWRGDSLVSLLNDEECVSLGSIRVGSTVWSLEIGSGVGWSIISSIRDLCNAGSTARGVTSFDLSSSVSMGVIVSSVSVSPFKNPQLGQMYDTLNGLALPGGANPL